MTTDGKPAGSVSSRAAIARTIGLDIVGPLVIYRVCHGAGLPTVWSLVVSGSAPGLGVLLDWLRWRTLEVLGAVVLGGIAVGIVLAVVSGNPKFVLLEAALTTTAFGVACLVSLTRRRPLIFYFAQAFYGGRHTRAGAELDADYVRFADARSFWRTVTIVWSIAYFVEAIGLVILVQTVSTGTALIFNRTGPPAVSLLLIAWALSWGNRLRAEKPDDPADAPATTEPSSPQER
jgi:intracellular septation protein A